MKAMLNETVVHIMGLLPEGSWVQPIQNRQAIFYRCIFLSGFQINTPIFFYEHKASPTHGLTTGCNSRRGGQVVLHKIFCRWSPFSKNFNRNHGACFQFLQGLRNNPQIRNYLQGIYTAQEMCEA
jgi:hypothetical protein